MIAIRSCVDMSFYGVFESKEVFFKYLESKSYKYTEVKCDYGIVEYSVENKNGDWVDDYIIEEYELNTIFGME